MDEVTPLNIHRICSALQNLIKTRLVPRPPVMVSYVIGLHSAIKISLVCRIEHTIFGKR